MTVKSEVLAQLDSLIETGNRLTGSYYSAGMGGYETAVPETDFRSFVTSALAAIDRIAGKTSQYYQIIPIGRMPTRLTVPGFDNSFIPSVTGALHSLRNAVDAGLLASLESRLRANIHDDFLTQASDLLSAGYHVAAMVLGGGVLENHLLKMAQARGLTWTGDGSITKYNDVLRGNAYEQPVWRRIQAIGDFRNQAAHGNGASIKADDVDDALRFIGRFIADNPT